MKDIQSDEELQLQLLVSGMHLSPEFGNTWQQIEQDGFSIDEKIEILLSSDSPVGIAKKHGVGDSGVC
ncbi:MAG: UDP-N-acetylglucosamine 2-epimerase [Escherichia coli]